MNVFEKIGLFLSLVMIMAILEDVPFIIFPKMILVVSGLLFIIGHTVDE